MEGSKISGQSFVVAGQGIQARYCVLYHSLLRWTGRSKCLDQLPKMATIRSRELTMRNAPNSIPRQCGVRGNLFLDRFDKSQLKILHCSELLSSVPDRNDPAAPVVIPYSRRDSGKPTALSKEDLLAFWEKIMARTDLNIRHRVRRQPGKCLNLA